MHAGSKNHGCEAIVNSLIRMTENGNNTILISYRADEDRAYSLKDMCTIYGERSFDDHKAAHILYYLYRKLTGDRESFIRYRYGDLLSTKNRAEAYPVAVSIGGDNYCYDVMLNDLRLANSAFNRQGTKTVLLGCSIEPELLKRADIREDLGAYHTIIARESITYEALKEAFGDGTGDHPQLYCIPDPAFTLPAKKDPELPDAFIPKQTVGINVSPLISTHEKESGITMEAYRHMIRYIIENTDLGIALIPHVVWDHNDDRKPMEELFRYAKEEGWEDRVCVIPDGDCETLKGYIAGCRFFVGARTHATIAAYSSCVPTLVVGYSVKSRGIARDLFPEGKEEGLVLPVQELKEADDLTRAFRRLLEREDEIRSHLETVIPDYVEKAYQVRDILSMI